MSGPEDQHPWDREDEEIRQAFAAKDAEIARLNNELKITIAVCNENTDLKKLVAEMANALDGWAGRYGGVRCDMSRELVRRAQAAVGSN